MCTSFTSGSWQAEVTYLKESIYENKDEIYDEDLISNEEFELLKQEKEREKFYKEQQAFIEYEERVHKRR